MNKFINLILVTSLVFCQNQTTQDVLQQIQKRAQDLNKPKNIEIENKFAQHILCSLILTEHQESK